MRIPKQRCVGCHRWFEPDPSKQGIQRYCSRKPCQRERHRLACQAYHRTNPDDDKSRRAKIRDWAGKKGYWVGWRAGDSDYREREKIRMRNKRKAAKRVAKRDARKQIFVEELESIQDQSSQTVAKRDVQDRRVDAILSCLIRNERSQNETHAHSAKV